MKEFVTPHLRTVLQTYQNSAPKSLQGPGHSLPSATRNSSATTTIVKKEVLSSPEPQDESPTYVQPPPPPPEIPQPILSAPDQDSGELLETVLEEKTIGCFFVGGELRLCLPQFLNTVLTEFSLEQINRIFEELCIFCSQCTPEQLNMFKDAKILPKDVKASGLITLTDAERLCSALLHRGCSVENRPKEAVSFKVYHKCFGKCEGICTPQMYSFGNPACIECVECKAMFSPQMFVGHAHGKPENRTCHWGFNSRNWRDYLHVALDIVDKREIYNEMLDNLKAKQQDEQQQRDRDLKYLKRKVDAVPPHIYPHEQLTVIPTKKQKLPDEQFHSYFQLQQALCNMQYDQVIRSAFHSWPWPMPYFQQEPILQNPERVVRLTGNERFDGGFQPNVALAPRKPPREREKEIEKDSNPRNNVAINSDIQIKQERPSSPDAIIQSPEATPTPPQISHPPPALVSRHTNLKPISLPHKKQHHHHLQPRSPDELSSSSEITSSTSPIPKTKDSIKNSKSPLTVISTQQQQQQQQHGNKLVQLQQRNQQDIFANDAQQQQQQQQTSRIRINKNLMNNSNIIRTPTPDMQNFKQSQHTSFPPPQPSPTSHMSSNHLQSIHQLNPAPTISPPAVALSLISRRQRDGPDDGPCTKPHQNGVENGEADSQTPHHVVMTPSPIPMTWESNLDALIKDIPQVHHRDQIWQIIHKILDDNAQLRSNQRLMEKKYQMRGEQIIDLQREIQYLRQQQLENQQLYHQQQQQRSPMNGVINDSVTVTPVLGPSKTSNNPQPIIKNDIVVEKIKMPLKKSSRRSFEEARVQNEVVNLKTSNQLTVTAMGGNGNSNGNVNPIQNNTTKSEDRDNLKIDDTISTTTTTITKKPQTTNSTITPTISPTSSSSSPDSAVFDIKHGGSDDQKSTSSSSSSPSPAAGISIKTEE